MCKVFLNNLLSVAYDTCQSTGWTKVYKLEQTFTNWYKRLQIGLFLRYIGLLFRSVIFEPRHDKTNKMSVRPAKTQMSLGIRPVLSESSVSAWRKLGSLATRWAHSEDSVQTGRMPMLIWVFAGRTLILLVLSCRCSFLLWPCFTIASLVLKWI